MTTMREKTHRGWLVTLAVCAAAVGSGTGVAHAVTISVVSPPALQEATGSARVCVVLDTAGQQVAGTQNDLQWDGSCLSLDRCTKSGSHGKDLNTSKLKETTGVRALVLSLQDINPMPSGDLYCCNFQASLSSPGSCCSISMAKVASSSPGGEALSTVGRGGQVCLSSGAAGSGLQGRPGAPQPGVVGTDLGTGAPPPAPAAPAAGGGAPAAPAAPGAPAVQVLPGGPAVPGFPAVPGVPAAPGVPAGSAPSAPSVPGQPQVPSDVARAPGAPAAPQAQAPGAVPAPPGQPPVAGATPVAPAAPAEIPAKPAPTAARVVVPPAKPPVAEKPAAAAPPVQPKPQSGCNCEIGTSDAGGSGLASLLVIAALLAARRRKL